MTLISDDRNILQQILLGSAAEQASVSCIMSICFISHYCLMSHGIFCVLDLQHQCHGMVSCLWEWRGKQCKIHSLSLSTQQKSQEVRGLFIIVSTSSTTHHVISYHPPLPTSLTRKHGLVNKVKFLGLAHTFASLQQCNLSNIQNILCQAHSKKVQKEARQGWCPTEDCEALPCKVCPRTGGWNSHRVASIFIVYQLGTTSLYTCAHFPCL